MPRTRGGNRSRKRPERRAPAPRPSTPKPTPRPSTFPNPREVRGVGPNILYKYLEREHAQSLIEHGVIKIGSLNGFRKMEQGEARGDPGEGTRELTHEILETQSLEDLKDNPIVTSFFRLGPNADPKKITFSGSTFARTQESEDIYIYCMTLQPSRKAMRAFHADTCVRIDNAAAFLDAITECLKTRDLHERGIMWKRCYYAPRSMPWDAEGMTGVNPAFLKAPQLAYQKEVRAAWLPKSYPIQSEIFECSELTKYVRLYTF